MEHKFKIVTILGSPHDAKSNTRIFVEDFVDQMARAGLALEHQVIPLGRKTVRPCKGCWNCTKEKKCPLADDDLEEIKKSMLECDMLILASPVYTNQVTAQMKALFDRLFTWCHIYPLLGKYSLSAVTTGNEGHFQTAAFLEKMLAAYGTYSFGSILSTGAMQPGFFPFREKAQKKYRKMAQKTAKIIIENKKPKKRAIQGKIFKIMKNKMTLLHTLNCMVNGVPQGQPAPPVLKLKLMRTVMEKMKIGADEQKKWSALLSFELSWWRERRWLRAKSFKQIAQIELPDGFDIKSRLLG